MTDVPGMPVHVVVTTDDGRSAALDVQLAPGAVQDVEVPLQPLATVSGRLIDGSTQVPVPDASTVIDRSMTRSGSTHTGGDGRFQLKAAAGSHTLWAVAPLFQPLNQDFVAQAGQVLDLGDVVLKRLAAQSGTIGALVRGDSGTPPTVVFLIPNGPADAAGMRLGDQVTAVDGQPVAGVADATARLKGAPNTPVQIAVSRSGAALALTVTRAP
jgi:hypothetical protein